MIRSSGSQLVLGLGLAGYAAVVLLPIAFLIAAAVALVVSPTEGPTSAVMTLSARQLGLLIRTVLLAGGVSAAVSAAKAHSDLEIRVECDTLGQVSDAIEAGADSWPLVCCGNGPSRPASGCAGWYFH